MRAAELHLGRKYAINSDAVPYQYGLAELVGPAPSDGQGWWKMKIDGKVLHVHSRQIVMNEAEYNRWEMRRRKDLMPNLKKVMKEYVKASDDEWGVRHNGNTWEVFMHPRTLIEYFKPFLDYDEDAD